MANENYILQLGMIQEEAKKLEEQFNILEQQIQEMEILKLSIKEVEKKENNDFLVPLGKGIFLQANLKNKEFLVNVGNGVVLKKTAEETIKIIEKQEIEIEKIKIEIEKRIQQINLELQKIMEEAQKEEHTHDDNCKH